VLNDESVNGEPENDKPERRRASVVPAASVVVAVLDGLPWLENQLRALATQEAPFEYEVVVADNGSTDGSLERAGDWARRDRRFRLVDASATRGPAAARNAAVQAAKGTALAFCDADDVVDLHWLAACFAALKESDVVAGCFDLWSLNGRPGRAPVPAATDQLGFLPAGLGSNLAVRRSAFEKVGGFDESLLVGEDVDLCWRLQLAGFDFALAPRAVVSRREPQRAMDVLVRGFRYGRNDPVLYLRHRSSGARRNLRGALRSWARLVLGLPLLLCRDERRPWLRGIGMRLGRLSGSVRRRVFYP
jgi:GT2 family glycosyltransferase